MREYGKYRSSNPALNQYIYDMRLTILWLCLIALVSCKKEGDIQDPVIQVTNPVDGAQYDVGDTIHLVMSVSDDIELANVEVKLCDVNLTPVMPTGTITTSGTGGVLHMDYLLDDASLPTGQYYLQATCHDAANNDSRDFVALNITEVPLELKGIIAVTLMPGFVTAQSIDTAWAASGLGTFPGDFSDAAVSSYWQQLMITGSISGMTRCISLDGNLAGWTVNPLPSAGPYWGKTSAHNRDWLINYRADGLIKTCSYNGTISTQYNANSGHVFRNFVFSGNYFYADMVDATGTSRLLGVYQGGGGATQQTTLSIDPIMLLPRDATTIYVAGNSAGQGKLLIYDYGTNGTWEPIALPAGKLLSATEIDANTLLLAMDNGNIYEFTYSPIGVLVWNAVSAQHVRYDPAQATVITAEGSAIKQYDYPATTLMDQITLSDSVRDVELWYNR